MSERGGEGERGECSVDPLCWPLQGRNPRITL